MRARTVLWVLAARHLDALGLARTPKRDLDAVARLILGHKVRQPVVGVDRRAVDRRDYVSDVQYMPPNTPNVAPRQQSSNKATTPAIIATLTVRSLFSMLLPFL
jgi:hypothetical protein